MTGDLARNEIKSYPKAAQVPPKKPRRTSASRARIAEIRAKKVDGQPCRVCGRLERVTAHHLIPRSLGGIWTESNIVPLCGSGTTGCHGDVEARHADACAKLRLSLDDSEYSFIVSRAGEGFLDRYLPVPRETFGHGGLTYAPRTGFVSGASEPLDGAA